MMFFNNKEKKRKLAEEQEAAKADAEFEAKFTAKQEKKKVEKIVGEMDKTINTLVARAAGAKAKGYTDIYKNCLSLIKVARARKKQAETFLFQMEAMQEMQALAKSSQELLGSMGSVMNSLGKLSLDKTVMLNSQKDFLATQRELEKQSMNIETYLSTMESNVDDGADGAQEFSDGDIEAEIDKFMVGNSINASSASSSQGGNDGGEDMEYLKKMLQN